MGRRSLLTSRLGGSLLWPNGVQIGREPARAAAAKREARGVQKRRTLTCWAAHTREADAEHMLYTEHVPHLKAEFENKRRPPRLCGYASRSWFWLW